MGTKSAAYMRGYRSGEGGASYRARAGRTEEIRSALESAGFNVSGDVGALSIKSGNKEGGLYIRSNGDYIFNVSTQAKRHNNVRDTTYRQMQRVFKSKADLMKYLRRNWK